MITVLYFWDIPRASAPLAIAHMAIDRLSLRGNKNISFYKSLGTGTGKTFTPRDADATRWGLLVVIEESAFEKFHNSSLINSWRKFAKSEYCAKLAPISSHGKWAGREPFLVNDAEPHVRKIAAITRARIKWRSQLLFWRATPPVIESLHSQEGLIAAIGIGEAPIGLQGTFSIWRDAASLRAFAYKGEAHAAVIDETARRGWYSEELFARFAVLEERGELTQRS